MLFSRFIFISLFFVVLKTKQTNGRLSLEDLFPFGREVGDTLMVKNDDGSDGPIVLPHVFPYFDNNHRQIYVANNGLFSFLSGIPEFNPEEFPLGNDRRLITPFWADIDTQGNTGNSSDNSVYYQVHKHGSNISIATRNVLDKAATYVRLYFPREPLFEPLMAVVGTWYRVGAYSAQIDRLNTFQMVIVTDEARSFTFLLYQDLQWAGKSYTSAPYAQAGFNAGDGITATMIKYSRTSDIVRLVNESNVNLPGLFAFRIDTTDIEAGGCGDPGTTITHLPIRGPQLGDTSVNLQGPCFESDAQIICRFGSYGEVPGVVINQYRARCLSPLADKPGQVELEVSLNNGTNFTSIGQFTYMSMTEETAYSSDILISRNGTYEEFISWNDEIDIEWSYSAAVLAGLPSDVVVDIEYEVYKSKNSRTSKNLADDDLEIDTVVVLASGIQPQIGRQSVHIDLSNITSRERFLPILPVVAAGAIRIVVRQLVKYAIKKTVQYIVKKTAEYACDAWSEQQPNPSTWNEGLPPCPNTLRQATVATGVYDADAICKTNGLPFVNCFFHKGRLQLQEDNAVACFRSRMSNIHGAGSQCCYNRAGEIITRGTGAGSDDRYHSGKYFWKHQLHDVIPFIGCCMLQGNPEKCNNYGKHRPARPGSNTNGQFGGTWGDPHFLTLDGTPYTFNGYGEYTYLAILEQQTSASSAAFNSSSPMHFLSQIRTVPLATSANYVTAIKAFAARSGSATVSITVSRRDQLLVHLNGDQLTFELDPDVITNSETVTHRFEDVTITKNVSSNQFLIGWSIGVSIEITPTPVRTAGTLVLNVAAAITDTFKGNWTFGLIGGYDGHSENDLRNSQGTVVGTVDTLTTEEIHELFGMTWAIAPADSLFFYETGDTSNNYASQNLIYRPLFTEPIAGTPQLESSARITCGITSNSSEQWTPTQRTCYYDIAITGDLAFGEVSRQAAEHQVEQREAMRNPPKFDTNALPLLLDVANNQMVRLSFQATSEFTTTIVYQLLNGPQNAQFDVTTGSFEWRVTTTDATQGQIPVKVSAQDTTYNLKSTHEVVLQVKRNSVNNNRGNSNRAVPLFLILVMFLFLNF